jgi:hypothetical protein
MRILIVADPLAGFKTYKDSTYAIMVAAVARGHALAFCEASQLWLEDGRTWADAAAISLAGSAGRVAGVSLSSAASPRYSRASDSARSRRVERSVSVMTPMGGWCVGPLHCAPDRHYMEGGAGWYGRIKIGLTDCSATGLPCL